LDREEHLATSAIASIIEKTIWTDYRIILDLEETGYITKRKEGRDNRPTIIKTLPHRRNHPQEIHRRELLQLISN